MANISAIKLPDGVTYNIKDDVSGYITGMTILSYGSSTWQNFIDAYNANKVVYCRASSNSNPATGSQTRLAFMAYVNNATTPTEVEFQYYRSVSSHSANQQGDQVYVYKLNSSGTWSVTTREAYTKITTGTGVTNSYTTGISASIALSLADTYGDTKNPYGTKTANYILAGPTSGNAAAPTFRALVAGDIPDLSSIYLTSSDLTGYIRNYSSGNITSGIEPHFVEEGTDAWADLLYKYDDGTNDNLANIEYSADSSGSWLSLYTSVDVDGENSASTGIDMESGTNAHITLISRDDNDYSVLELSNSKVFVRGGSDFNACLSTSALTADKDIAFPNASGTIALTSDIPTVPSTTGSATTGISIANHSTDSIYGVSSSTTSVYGVSTSTTTASKVTVGSHSTDYGVTAAGSASSWTFEEKEIPNVTAVGSGSASLTFTMDTTDTKKLVIAFSHTHTAPTLGTAISVQSKSGGSNGTAPTLGSKVPTVSASDVTVPIKNADATTVPIKNVSATTVVTSATHSVTDNGHTHTI